VVAVHKTVGTTANWVFDTPIDTDDIDPVATGLRIDGQNGTYQLQVDPLTLKVIYGAAPVVGQGWALDPTAFSAVFIPPGSPPAGQSGLVVS